MTARRQHAFSWPLAYGSQSRHCMTAATCNVAGTVCFAAAARAVPTAAAVVAAASALAAAAAAVGAASLFRSPVGVPIYLVLHAVLLDGRGTVLKA